LEWKMLVYFVPILHFLVGWYILWPFGNFVIIMYIFHRFGMLRQDKIWQPCS
jgi:hypothetical protein